MADVWKKVLRTGELTKGKGRLVRVEKLAVAVFLYQGTYFAFEDLCPHRGGPISENSCEKGVVTCPWHGARFDLKTGLPLSGPASRPLRSFETQIREGSLYVKIQLQGSDQTQP